MPDAWEFARNAALDRLTESDRSRSDLAAYLARRGVEPQVAEQVLDRLEEVGLVDDERFAAAWVQSRQRSKGLARRALAAELRRKGIDADIAASALDGVDPQSEVTAARQLVRSKLRSLAGLDQAVRTRRLAGMLARKGYDSSVAYEAIRHECSLDTPLDSS